MDQSDAPLLDAPTEYQRARPIQLHFPGAPARPRYRSRTLAALGTEPFRADVLAGAGLDDRSSSGAVLKAAETLMPQAVGAAMVAVEGHRQLQAAPAVQGAVDVLAAQRRGLGRQRPDAGQVDRGPAPELPATTAARVSPSAGARSPAPASSAPDPVQEAGTPAGAGSGAAARRRVAGCGGGAVLGTGRPVRAAPNRNRREPWRSWTQSLALRR